MNNSRKGKRPTTQKRGKNFADKAKSKYDEVKESYVPHQSKTNDWRWYAANEQLLKDSASYAYGYPLGNPINYGPEGLEANKWSIPGICRIDIAPTIGWASGVNSPVNVASRNIFSYIRHANSGSSNYDAPDLMLYLLAMDNAYSMLSFLKRIYGTVLTYSHTNRYFPKAIVESMGVDFEDISSNLADFRALINTYVVKVGSFCVPATMSYMAKHMWMYSGLYYDQPVEKAQVYYYCPMGYYTYALDEDGAGMLQWHEYNGGIIHDFEWFKTTMDSIIDPIISGLGAQDFNIMSGDILKAFGEGNVIKLESLPEGYTVLPSYDETILDQIQNLTLAGLMRETGHADTPTGWTGQDIRQDATKGHIVHTPYFTNYVNGSSLVRPASVTAVAGDNCFSTRRIVTFDHDGITPAETMEATRLTNIAHYKEYVPNKYATRMLYNTMGSEVACRCCIYRYVVNPQGIMQLQNAVTKTMSWTFLNQITDGTSEVSQYYDMFKGNYDQMNQALTLLGYFHRHFPVAVTAGIIDEGTGTWAYDSFNGYQFDVNNYTVLDADDLEQMSETALISEFAITQFGRAVEK